MGFGLRFLPSLFSSSSSSVSSSSSSSSSKRKCRVRNGNLVKRTTFFPSFVSSILFLCFLDVGVGFYTSECNGPLGMESLEIKNAALSASSSFDTGNVGPQNARVRLELQGGAWCPKNQVTSVTDEWLEVDLQSVHVITGAETQGRFGNGQGAEFAENYVLSYWRPELGKWVRYRDNTGNEILQANINTYTPAKVELKMFFVASKIRFHPYSHHKRTVCMRVEIYGCPFRGGLLSYQMPQGSKRGETWNFYDQTYDGTYDGGVLRNGLGQLVDGRGGPDNFKDDFYEQRGKGWVGWKNDSKTNGHPVELVFKFDTVREFNAIHIHTSNQFTKEIQVFQEAAVFLSIGGKIYAGEPITYFPMEDCIFEDPKNISIKLHRRLGRHVKIQLFWAAKWILISEVTFDSQPATGSFSDESLPTSSISPEEENGLMVSDGFQLGSPPITSGKGHKLPPNETEWSSGAIVMTAIVSSFVAILLVLLFLLSALLLRNKVRRQKKRPAGSNGGTLPYDNQTEFGYMAPQPSGKWKLSSAEYQEPFIPLNQQALSSFPSANQSGAGVVMPKEKMAEYYSSSLVSTSTPPHADSCNEYEYAVPNELGKLLPQTLSSPMKRIPNSPAPARLLSSQLGFRQLGIPEIPKHQLRMLRKLGDGAFGTVFIGELGSGHLNENTLVAVKHLLKNSSEKDKSDFLEEVRLLASLDDPNVAQVLGVCTEEEPFCVLLEFLELGDLCQFLRQNDSFLPNAPQRLDTATLLYLAVQVASGMRFLESRNIVHRDLATRNCVIGRGLVVKVSHFATDTDLYSADYFRLDGKIPLPIRWMAWESLFLGKYSTKSDVWSFGVTLWEIISFCRHSPHPTLSNAEVLHNLRRLSLGDEGGEAFEPLGKPSGCSRDIYQLMTDTWRRDDEERPSFWEIHSFLTRRNANFVPPVVGSPP